MLNFYNELHLGDCIYHIPYCRKLIDANPGLEIKFYIRPQYFNEVQNFIGDYNITLYPVSEKPLNAVDTWLNRSGKFWPEWVHTFQKLNDLIYVELFNEISNVISIENPIKCSYDHLIDDERLLINNELSGHFDYLIINSGGFSGQWNDVKCFNTLINKLKLLNKKVVTTAPNTASMPCTLDYNLSIFDIGNISTNCENIIGVHTAPFASALNVFNIDKLKSVYLCQVQGLNYSFKMSIV